jgi:hypothetical protein
MRPVALAALLAGCSAPPPADSPLPPEVTLHDVRLHNFRESTLSAVGTAKDVSYERATADVHATRVDLDVFRLEAPVADGGVPATTHLRAGTTLGNLLTRGVDASEGVTARTPGGLEGRTARAFFDTPDMRATGSTPVRVEGPDGFRLRAEGFALDLRAESYEFTHPLIHTRGP